MPNIRTPPNALSSWTKAGSMPSPNATKPRVKEPWNTSTPREDKSTPLPRVAAKNALEIKSMVPLMINKLGLFNKASSMQPMRVIEPRQKSIMASENPLEASEVHRSIRACNPRPWPSAVPSTKAKNKSMGASVSKAIMAPMAKVKSPMTAKVLSLS